MINNVFETLFDEISKIRDFVNENNTEYKMIENIDGIEYHVILKNGISFFISIGTNKFPEFKKDDILYIRKKRFVKDIVNYEFIDTEIGDFNTEDQLTYGINMETRFYAVEDFNTGCFE